LAPTSTTASQADAAPDLLVTWTPSTAGTPATGAEVVLYIVTDGVAKVFSEVTCGGGCVSETFRELSVGTTYQAEVFPTNTVGTGSPGGTGAVTLINLCPVGACVALDATQSVGTADQADAGILNSVYPVGDVGADLAALKTPMYRSAPSPSGSGTFDWSDWNVAVGAGAKTILILSNEYSAAYPGGPPPTPWSDWTAYNEEITTLVTQLSQSGEPIDYWEVYNEPGGDDGYYSAAGYASETPAELLDQFLYTYQDIRAVVPNAAIIGPSLEHWSDYPGQYGTSDNAFDMDTFLNFAATNDLQLAAISWHEIDDTLGPTPEEDVNVPADIEDHVSDARRLIASLPALGHPKIFIDEYELPELVGIPGWDVSYLSALTEAGVDQAGLACWGSACGNPDLDGLIINGTQTTATYDERLVYASMSGNMIATDSSSDFVTALGSYNSTTGSLTALIGRGQGCAQNATCAAESPTSVDEPSIGVDVTVTVPWTSGTANIALTDFEGQTAVPPSTPSPVNSVVPVVPNASGGGTVTISVPSFADGDAYGLVMSDSENFTSPPTTTTTTTTPPTRTTTTTTSPVVTKQGQTTGKGYWLVASDGGVFAFGDAGFYGSTGALHLNKPIVGMASTPDGKGYWLVASDGGIFAFGDAGFYGSTGALHLNKPIVGMASTPDGKGYWLVASDGGIFAFGDANFYGTTGPLNTPIVGMASTPDGGGYWLAASDGAVFALGDASFYGSTGPLNKPIVGMSSTPDGGGYWLVASDGGIFAFGDAGFYGSTGALHLNKPIVGMASTPDGKGYWLVASDGGIFAFGDANFYGSTGGKVLNRPVVSMASS
jgi:hypothetical protein